MIKALKAVAIASVLASGACAPSANTDDNHSQTSIQNSNHAATAHLQKEKNVEVSIQFKLKTGQIFTIKF